MATPKSLIIVGSSGSGKTTLVDGLRGSEYEPSLVIPRRYSTRPARPSDDRQNIERLDSESFEQRVDEGSIWPHWRWGRDIGRTELYGFSVLPPDESRLVIYAANNAFLRTRNESVEEVLASGLVVIAAAGKGVRQERMERFRLVMPAAEHNFRIDHGDNLVEINGQEKIIDTSNLTPEEGQLALQAIVNQILYKK